MGGRANERERKMQQAIRDARFLLTPAAHRNTHRDAWQLDRARWHWQYGDRKVARAELKNINDYRDLRRWNQESTEADVPLTALRDPVGAEVPV